MSLTSFSLMRRINISARLENIYMNDDCLKLEFTAYDSKKGTIVPFSGWIDILRNDSLYVRLSACSSMTSIVISKKQSVPDGFKLVYPDIEEGFPKLSKAEDLKFIFSNLCYWGEWKYQSFFSNENSRWMFNESGDQIVKIYCSYEPWLIGGDVIKVRINKEYQVSKSTFKVLDENDNNIGFELKQKRNPTNAIALKLKNKSKKGEKLKVIIDIDNERHFEEIVHVPERNPIGLFGKYNDL
jgi:hypothetical protein